MPHNLQNEFDHLCNHLQVPGPQRGEIVRQIGHALREKKDALGNLVRH